MLIQQISAEETYPLRHKVLRKGKDISTCQFPLDHEKSTAHYGLLMDQQIVAILSVYEVQNSNFISQFQLQLRGMAVSENFHGQGLGKQLLEQVLQDIKLLKPKADLIWCNARKEAFNFYQKLGFEFNSDEFEIEGVGTHRLMSKNL